MTDRQGHVPLRVLVIGLGRIGMGYDYDLDPAAYVLTHARAFEQHPDFELVGGVDADSERRRLFEARFAVPAFAQLEESAAVAPDIVVVAVPTEIHDAILSRALQLFRPQAVLCEKPLAANLDAAVRLSDSCRAANCLLFVNYMRRSDVTVAEIRQRMIDGRMCPPFRGVVWYSGGLFNSASHFVNLSEYLLGRARMATRFRPLATDNGQDPDFFVNFERGDMVFRAARMPDFFHNTMEIVAANGRLRYEAAGASAWWEPTHTAGLYGGYSVLSGAPEQLPGDFARSQWHVADQLARCLAGTAANLCGGDDAVDTLRVLSHVQGEL